MKTKYDIVMDNKIIEFNEKFHPEFKGYLAEEKDGVFISQIKTIEKSKGHFSKLIKELKVKYNWIKIPTPSASMFSISSHLGFKHTREKFPPPWNEIGDIMLWRKK